MQTEMQHELELKHLAPYLPYGLNLYYEPKSMVVKLLPAHFSGDWIANIISKPILRPLSDLTKEIEHNGNGFVPAMVLWSCDAKEEEDFELYKTLPDFWKTGLKLDFSNDLDYRDMKKLFEWHFDVFGLIEKGLAVDINTIK